MPKYFRLFWKFVKLSKIEKVQKTKIGICIMYRFHNSYFVHFLFQKIIIFVNFVILIYFMYFVFYIMCLEIRGDAVPHACPKYSAI